MTPEQLERVRETAVVVERALDECARCFYDDLSHRHPSARRLLADDRMAEGRTFVDELLGLIAASQDLRGFLTRARALGLRLQRRGIHTEDYAFVGDALVAAVGGVVGDRWTTAVEASWRRMFALIVDAMLEGAEAGLFSPSDGGAA